MWTCEHSVDCAVEPSVAWRFWSNVTNWAAVDPAIESVTVDGAFAVGAIGTTKQPNLDPVQWKIVALQDGESAVLEIRAPGVVGKFHWRFAAMASGTRITQRVTMEGEQVDDYAKTIGVQLEKELPGGMQRLVDAIVEAASKEK